MLCPHCGSNKVHKDGVRERKSGKIIQEYECQHIGCNKYFSTTLQDAILEEVNKNHVSPGDILRYNFDKPIRIHAATDIHHGACEHNWKLFDRFIETVNEDPDARWFMNGDNIELIPPGYKISQRGQSMEPDEQQLTFFKRIEKIADKCLFIRGGNHDYIRSVNLLGFDVSKALADRLDCPYFELPGYMQLNVEGRDWNLVSAHGKSGGKNGDLELDKMAAVYSQGDVFYAGHNHQLYCKPIDSLIIHKGEERLHRRWYVRGGSFLNYADYARYSAYPIVRAGWITMEFNKSKIKAWTNYHEV